MKQQPELGVGEFAATQKRETVMVTAWGDTPTPGYKVWLEMGPEDVWPPIFNLWWQAPDDAQPDVLAPFHVYTHFESQDTIDALTVRDRNGTHEIKVQQLEG